jgi:hypothetical protein
MPFLHVANGTCTTRLIEAAGIPGATSIWADPLHDGPVPGGLTDAELLEVRTRHLTEPAGPVDPVNDMGRWRAVIARHPADDELILWFEHDLFDQLNLIQLLTWIRQCLPRGKVVSLVCIGSFPGHPRFKGLGELTPGELGSLLGSRQRVADAQYSLAELAWAAFREATPEPLDQLRRADTSALPYLGRALTRFLQEYPWTTDGLARSERRLLRLAEAGGIDLPAALPRMHDDEDAYYITDTSVAALAEDLSRLSPPLITLTTGESGENPLRGAVALTDVGREVLAGQQDRLDLCGIDRWLGGVHLRSGATLWRWDEQRQRVTSE